MSHCCQSRAQGRIRARRAPAREDIGVIEMAKVDLKLLERVQTGILLLSES
jgi:hypothetical protein